jgi:nicotinate phosphoribosyltransferase
MLSAYDASGLRESAVFELFVRALPRSRRFLVAAGLEQAVDFLENLRFGRAELDYLEQSGRFSPGFVERLSELRFTGDVDAVPEGTIVFENEPLVRVMAPLREAQFVEARLMNLVHFETVIASKAVRSVLAAPGKILVDFGLRRAQGFEAGLLAARAAYLAGFAGTATVLADMHFGVPLYGTMAHSFVEAHDDELAAFRAFAQANPENTVLLIDTYDTEEAAKKVVALSREGFYVRGVRIDSGDLGEHARRVRRILDAGGLEHCTIFASGGLDEFALRDLMRAEAPIDGFGVGTHVDTSSDAPYLDCAYKLEEYAGRPRRKRSEGKATWPGRKQVFRRRTPKGMMIFDTVTLEGDRAAQGEPLLVPTLRGGHRIAPPESLETIRRRVASGLATLPAYLRPLEAGTPYPVRIAQPLRQLADQVDEMNDRSDVDRASTMNAP